MDRVMLNDPSSALSLLETRRSGRPREMVGSGPSADELERMLTIAARTPDHGKLCPWRFIIVGEDQRDKLAALLRRAVEEEEPRANAAHFEKAEAFANYQGALVVLVSAPVVGHKIDVWEQELSCGAAGMNLLHAAHAMGYVAGWLTGRHAYSPRVIAAFCQGNERIAGFIFIAQPGNPLLDRPRPNLELVVRQWDGGE